MTSDTFDAASAVRKRPRQAKCREGLAGADEFSQPMQEAVTEYCWGAVWGAGAAAQDPEHADLAMLSALNRRKSSGACPRRTEQRLTRAEICECCSSRGLLRHAGGMEAFGWRARSRGSPTAAR